MKKLIGYRLLVLSVVLFTFTAMKGMAQPDPPPLPGNHGMNGNYSPQGTPLDNGTGTFLILGIIYMMRGIIRNRKAAENEY